MIYEAGGDFREASISKLDLAQENRVGALTADDRRQRVEYLKQVLQNEKLDRAPGQRRWIYRLEFTS